jgi:hypothetical protein
MKRIPSVTQDDASDVTGMPTTPNMCSIPVFANARAASLLPSTKAPAFLFALMSSGITSRCIYEKNIASLARESTQIQEHISSSLYNSILFFKNFWTPSLRHPLQYSNDPQAGY